MRILENVAAALFGAVFVFLSFAVAVETVMRKVFNVSLQGVDELGGYALALGSALAFTLALIARAHIRIDLVHDRLPRLPRIALNVVAVAANAVVAIGLVVMAWYSLRDSISLNSTAQTPWATPLRYPQSLWLGALVVFALAAAAYLGRVLWLLVRGRAGEVERRYSPRGAKDELKEELDDLRSRGIAGVGAGDDPR